LTNDVKAKVKQKYNKIIKLQFYFFGMNVRHYKTQRPANKSYNKLYKANFEVFALTIGILEQP
jgi:hypothetical protein